MRSFSHQICKLTYHTAKGLYDMKILIDGDGCPVIHITEQIAETHQIPVTILTDTNHQIRSSYSEIITVEQGNDAVDFALFGLIQKDDIVITQDYGVASLALSKGAHSLHQNGWEYTPDNIDMLLMERHLGKKQRQNSRKKHYKPIPKRTENDNELFRIGLERLLERV